MKSNRRRERHRYKERRDKKHRSECGWWRGVQRGAAEPVEEYRRKEAKGTRKHDIIHKTTKKCMRTRRHSSVQLTQRRNHTLGRFTWQTDTLLSESYLSRMDQSGWGTGWRRQAIGRCEWRTAQRQRNSEDKSAEQWEAFQRDYDMAVTP